MQRLETYLFFDGDCAEAMRFYESVLGGKLQLLQAKEAPDGGAMFGGNPELIMHARLDLDGAVLMGSDWLAPQSYPGKSGFSVTLTAPTVDAARSLFDRLSADGQVTMAIEKTFYSDAFGMLVDRFGTPWMVMAETSSGS